MLRRHPILTILLVLFFLAIASLALLVATFDLNRFRDEIQASLSGALSQPVHLGAARLSLRHGPAVDFADLRIGAGEGETGVLRAEHLLLKLEILPLLRKEVVFSEVSLERPHCSLTLQPTGEAQTGEPSLALLLDQGVLQKTVIRSLAVRNGTLHLVDRRVPENVYTLNIEGLDAEIADLALDRPVRLQVSGSIVQEGVSSPFSLGGAVAVASARPDWRCLDVDLRMSLENFAPGPVLRRYLATEPQLDAAGALSLQLALRGTADTSMRFDGRLAGAELQWNLPDLYSDPLVFRELRCRGTWRGDGDRLGIADLALTADDLAIAGEVTLDRREEGLWLEGELTDGRISLLQLDHLLPDAQPDSTAARLKKRLGGGLLEIAAARFSGPVTGFARLDENFPLQQAELRLRDATIHLDRVGALRALDFFATLDRERITVRDGTGLLLGAPIRFAGALHSPFAAGHKLELQADGILPLQHLLALAPSPPPQQLSATGPLPLQIRLEGPPQRLLLDLRANLEGIVINWEEKPVKAAGAPGDLFLTGEISSDRLELSHGRLQLAPLELRGRGEIKRQGKRDFFLALDLAPLQLQAATPFLPPLERLAPRGAISAHYEWTGGDGALRNRGGSLFLHDLGLHLTNNLAEINDANGELRILEDSLEFERVSAKLGISPIRVDGAVRHFAAPRIDLHVTAQTLRADELIFPSDKALLRDVDGHLAIDRNGIDFAPVKVRLDRGTSATVKGRLENFGAPQVTLDIEAERANIDEVIALWQTSTPRPAAPAEPSPSPQGRRKVALRIDARVGEGVLGPLHFQNASGVIGLDDGALVIFPLRFAAGAGRCTGRVEVDKTTAGTSLLKMSGHLENFDAESVQHELLKRRGLVTGVLHGDFFLEGEPGRNFLPTSLGGFNLHIKDGVLRKFQTLSKVFSILNVSQLFALKLPDMATEGMPFRRLKGNFSLNRGVLGTDDLVVDSNAMNLSLVGQTNLISGEIDAVLGVKPLRTVDKIVTQIPIAGWLLAGEEKALITAHFELTGKSDAPQVTPIPITSVSEKVLGIFKRVLGLPGKMVTDVGELLQGEEK